MPCPLYEDFTRGCVEKFKVITKFITFDVCEAEDDFKNCIFYKAIIENKPICPSLEECSENFNTLSTQLIIKLIKSDKILKTLNLDEYCFSNNYVNCVRLNFFKEGKRPPSSLRPDGTKLKLTEFLIKATE
jgi:hypothetical protein